MNHGLRGVGDTLGTLHFKGDLSLTINPLGATYNNWLPAANAGDVYRIVTIGKPGGVFWAQPGSIIMCTVDGTPAGPCSDLAAFGWKSIRNNWIILRHASDIKAVVGQLDKVNTSFSSIPNTSVILIPSFVYRFRGVFYTTSNVAAGIKFNVTLSAGTTSYFVYDSMIFQTGVAVAPATASRGTTSGVTIADKTAVTTATVIIEGVISLTAASVNGSMDVRFAQNVVNAAASSVLVGSTFEVEDITQVLSP